MNKRRFLEIENSKKVNFIREKSEKEIKSVVFLTWKVDFLKIKRVTKSELKSGQNRRAKYFLRWWNAGTCCKKLNKNLLEIANVYNCNCKLRQIFQEVFKSLLWISRLRIRKVEEHEFGRRKSLKSLSFNAFRSYSEYKLRLRELKVLQKNVFF